MNLNYNPDQLYKTERTSSGVVFVLPHRDLGRHRHFGWFVFGLGLLSLAFMVTWVSTPAFMAVQMIGQQAWAGAFLLIFASFGLVGLFQSIKILLLGLLVVRNRTRCRVELRNGRLFCNEQLGWFTWRRSCSIKTIERFELTHPLDREQQDKEQLNIGNIANNDWLAIRAIGPKSRGFLIAPGYPRNIIEALATELADQIDRERVDSRAVSITEFSHNNPNHKLAAAASLTIVDMSSDQVQEAKKPLLPDDSRIQVHRRPDQLAYEISPAGVWKGSKGLFSISIIWLVIVVPVSISLIVTMISDPIGFWPTIGGIAFISMFWVAGIGMMLAAINMGRRSVMIGVLVDQVFIERKSIFGNKWLEFAAAQIKQICVGPSGMEVNSRPVMELQIHTVDGKKQGLLTQLTQDELDWLAYELQNALALDTGHRTDNWKKLANASMSLASPEYSSIADELSIPEASSVDVQRDESTTRINIPALGKSRVMSGLGIGASVIIVAAIGVAVISNFDVTMMLISVVLASIGLAMIVGRFIYVTRRFELTIVGTDMSITRSDCCGQRMTRLSADDIQWIDIQPSGTRINNADVMMLTIRHRSKENTTLMFGRPAAEIAYVAAVLNQFLLPNVEASEQRETGEIVADTV